MNLHPHHLLGNKRWQTRLRLSVSQYKATIKGRPFRVGFDCWLVPKRKETLAVDQRSGPLFPNTNMPISCDGDQVGACGDAAGCCAGGEFEQPQWLAKKIALRCKRSSSLSSSLRLSIISYLLTSEENTKIESQGLKVYSRNVRLSDRVNSREKQKRIGKSAE